MTLISKLNPHTPRIWNPLEESNYKKVSSTEFISLIPKKDFKFFLLCHLKSYKSIRTLSSMVVGTSKSHQRIRKKDIFELETLCFPDTIAILFEDNLKQIYKKIEFNLNQIKILTELRDALLPKLISGKLRISDAEKIINKVSV